MSVHRAKVGLAGHDITDRVVMHVDDNPLNVRLDNLRVGTQAENVADMLKKGRGAKSKPRFTPVMIAEVVRLKDNGNTINQIARQMGKHRHAVRRLLDKVAAKDTQETAQCLIDFTRRIVA